MQNRELSWLRFNERVLEEAADDLVPPLERVKFISIFVSNLTEFFMVRVGRLTDYLLIGDEMICTKTHLSPSEQLQLIFKETKRLYQKKDAIYFHLKEELASKNITHADMNQLDPAEEEFLRHYFRDNIQPILSPQLIDFYLPFPFLENDQLYICVELEKNGNKCFGMVPIPARLPAYVKLVPPQGASKILPQAELTADQGFKFVLMEDIVQHFIADIFDNYQVLSCSIINITRNQDLVAGDEAVNEEEDYPEYMAKILKKRKRLDPVRLESLHPMSEAMQKFLQEKLKLAPEQCFAMASPLKLAHIFAIEDELEHTCYGNLFYGQHVPAHHPFELSQTPMVKQLEQKDVLLSYPYQDISAFLKLIEAAAHSKKVYAIKITIYRLAHNSELVKHLITAAENGKEVVVLMELKARFDEAHNIEAAKLLYHSGCQIIYGYETYKVHSKICLITYKKGGQIKTITQIGTGNYNEKTAKLYTDLCLLTTNPAIGQDAIAFFNNLSTENIDGQYQHLLQSPTGIKPKIIALIEREMAKKEEGYLFLKMNSLTDKDIIKKLRDASCAGVTIKMLIRGITCLLPGIPGETENIEIHSIVGKFLEHPRIYLFGRGEEEKIYITSADLMTRNMERRVEVATPILDPTLKADLRTYLEKEWADDLKGRVMDSAGHYHHLEDNQHFIVQDYFVEEARQKEQAFRKAQAEDKNFLHRLKLFFQRELQ